MPSLTINLLWRIDENARVHIGNGLSRIGYADRCLQTSEDGKLRYWGDSAKGAIRQSAEALLRWLVPGVPPEKSDSAPLCGAMTRIFQPDERGKLWRFGMPKTQVSSQDVASTWSSTAIDKENGVARTGTLRTKEAWSRGALLATRIEAFQLDLSNSSPDWLDAVFVLAAITATEQIGGSRGSGFGEVHLETLDVSESSLNGQPYANGDTVLALQKHLAKDFETVPKCAQ